MKFKYSIGSITDIKKLYEQKFYLPFRNNGDFRKTKRDLISYQKKYYISLMEEAKTGKVYAYNISRQRNEKLITMYESNIISNFYNEKALFKLLIFCLKRILDDGYSETIIDIPANSFLDLYRFSFFNSEVVGLDFTRFWSTYGSKIPILTIRIRLSEDIKKASLIPFKKLENYFYLVQKCHKNLNEKYVVNCGSFYILRKTCDQKVETIIEEADQICKFCKMKKAIIGIPSTKLLLLGFCLIGKMSPVGYVANFYDNESYILLS